MRVQLDPLTIFYEHRIIRHWSMIKLFTLDIERYWVREAKIVRRIYSILMRVNFEVGRQRTSLRQIVSREKGETLQPTETSPFIFYGNTFTCSLTPPEFCHVFSFTFHSSMKWRFHHVVPSKSAHQVAWQVSPSTVNFTQQWRGSPSHIKTRLPSKKRSSPKPTQNSTNPTIPTQKRKSNVENSVIIR